nr:MAG TPA: hypothetical protein [Caudoviricetes sp.]
MSTMITVEQFPSEMALIMAHLAEQVSNASNKMKFCTCGKLYNFFIGTRNNVGIFDLEEQDAKSIQNMVDDGESVFLLVKYVELEDKTDG